MLIIVTKNEGQTLYLRGPVWTSCIDKAAKYGTIEQATAAIEKAKKFMHPHVYKAIVIMEA